MPTSDGLQFAAQFELTALSIISASGQVVDLREVMRELNLFEDLFGNSMTGNLFINDTQDLINVLPILGTEYLRVTLIKPSTPWKIEKVFRVYKVSDRRKASQSSEDYILHFCSEELILSESIKVSNVYKATTISQMVKDIAVNYLKIDSTKLPSDAITSTVGNYDVVIPMWTPFHAINWLARMAKTGLTLGCSFVFYEDNVGYKFASIETLTQQAPVQVVNFMPLNMAGATGEKGDASDTEQRLQSAEEFRMTNSPDLMRSITAGMYAGKLMIVNLMDQQVKPITLSGTDFFKKTKHTNDNSFMQTPKDRTQIKQTEHHESFYRVAVDNLKVDTWMLQRNAYLSALHGFQIKVSIPGNMNLRVGSVVTLNLPAASIGRREKKPMDVLYSGNYLVTAIRHKVDRDKYVCILELSKDSLLEPLPDPLENHPSMKKLRQS